MLLISWIDEKIDASKIYECMKFETAVKHILIRGLVTLTHPQKESLNAPPLSPLPPLQFSSPFCYQKTFSIVHFKPSFSGLGIQANQYVMLHGLLSRDADTSTGNLGISCEWVSVLIEQNAKIIFSLTEFYIIFHPSLSNQLKSHLANHPHMWHHLNLIRTTSMAFNTVAILHALDRKMFESVDDVISSCRHVGCGWNFVSMVIVLFSCGCFICKQIYQPATLVFQWHTHRQTHGQSHN